MHHLIAMTTPKLAVKLSLSTRRLEQARKRERQVFVAAVAATIVTPEKERHAQSLVKTTRDAKEASFLNKFRVHTSV